MIPPDDLEAEIQAIAASHGAVLERYLRWGKLRLPHHLVGEVINDALLVVAGKRRNGLAIENMRSYLFAVTRNAAIDVLQSRGLAEIPANDLIGGLGSLSFSLVDLETSLDLRQALSKLPQRQRQVIALRYLGDYSVKETAAILSVAEGTIGPTTTAALRRLRQILSSQGGYEPQRGGGHSATSPITRIKVLITGGFGVGKTTFIHSLSEITPLYTDADNATGTDALRSPGVFDFGRITLADDLILYLFGAPSAYKFWLVWDDLAQGAAGSVVLVNTSDLTSSFPAVDYLEASGLPFVVGVDSFDSPTRPLEDVRYTLAIAPDIPLIPCDARSRDSAKACLAELFDHAQRLQTAGKAVAD
jgi:uncharacterized protein